MLKAKQKNTHPRRIAIELRHDLLDNRYRWFIMETDENTEVSGATPIEAWRYAKSIWRNDTWNLKKISPTVFEIDADDGGCPLEAICPSCSNNAVHDRAWDLYECRSCGTYHREDDLTQHAARIGSRQPRTAGGCGNV